MTLVFHEIPQSPSHLLFWDPSKGFQIIRIENYEKISLKEKSLSMEVENINGGIVPYL